MTAVSSNQATLYRVRPRWHTWPGKRFASRVLSPTSIVLNLDQGLLNLEQGLLNLEQGLLNLEQTRGDPPCVVFFALGQQFILPRLAHII